MIQINKPVKLEVVQCYKCGTLFKVSTYTNMNANYLTDCDRHKKDKK